MIAFEFGISISTVWNVAANAYRHVVPPLPEDAAAALDRVFGG